MAKKISQPARRSGKAAKADLISAAQAKLDQAKAAVNAADAKLVAAADANDQAGIAAGLAERTAADSDVSRYQAALDLLLNSEATTSVVADQNVATNASPAAGATSKVTPATPSSGAATGTNSTNEPPVSDDQGGAGDTAGSAGSDVYALDALGGTYLGPEAEFRARYPRMSAELDAWKAANADEDVPSALRIRSKIEGFRRAGIAHSKAPVEHQLGALKGPEQLEALFAEPNLVVELI